MTKKKREKSIFTQVFFSFDDQMMMMIVIRRQIKKQNRRKKKRDETSRSFCGVFLIRSRIDVVIVLRIIADFSSSSLPALFVHPGRSIDLFAPAKVDINRSLDAFFSRFTREHEEKECQ